MNVVGIIPRASRVWTELKGGKNEKVTPHPGAGNMSDYECLVWLN